ncbi:MAG: type II secretion system protein [Planctomycetes bacterium]|nr:type II secretion system protein [Planctomycetota bacterium]
MLINSKRKGFSLIELVIVIVILGIVAAIAIPRIGSGSRNAGESALTANLASIRNAIDWYYSDHHNSYPGAKADGLGNAADSEEALVSQLTLYSDADGNCSADKDAAFPYGPYIRGNFPNLSVGANNGENTVTMVNQAEPCTSTPGDGNGWVYNTNTGQIIANADETGTDGIAYDAR